MRERIKELHRNGLSQRNIAKEVGLSRSRVAYILKHDLKGRDYSINNKCIELYNKGIKIGDIAKEVGLSKDGVNYHLTGVPKRFNGKVTHDMFEEAFNRCKTSKEVQNELGISSRTYYNFSKGRKIEGVKIKIKIKKMKRNKVVKEVIPAEISRDLLGKGFERGAVREVKVRDNRDEGRSVSFKYSEASETPTISISIRVKDNISDIFAAKRWCTKFGKKRFSLNNFVYSV